MENIAKRFLKLVVFPNDARSSLRSLADYACASPRLYIPSDYNPQTGLAGPISPAASPRDSQQFSSDPTAVTRVTQPPAKTYHQLTTAHDSVFDLNGIERTFFAKAVAEARGPCQSDDLPPASTPRADVLSATTSSTAASTISSSRSATPNLLAVTTVLTTTSTTTNSFTTNSSISSNSSGGHSNNSHSGPPSPTSTAALLPTLRDLREATPSPSPPSGPGGGGIGGTGNGSAGVISDGRSARSKRRLYSSSASNCSSDSERSSSPSSGKYVCLECGKHYATSSNLSRHKQTHRSPDSQLAKKCPTCDKVRASSAGQIVQYSWLVLVVIIVVSVDVTVLVGSPLA